MKDQELPFVSIIMPCRNEIGYIDKALQSIVENDYPKNQYEVLVMDGMSDDGTRDVIEKISMKYDNIRLVDNSDKIVPHAMNQGIKQSKGSVIIRIDSHAVVDNDFISQSIQVLQEHPDAWCVGGVMKTIGTTFWGNIISEAMSSPFGVGSGNFRTGKTEGYTDAVIFGAHHRWVFDKVGYFDEELVRNQDDEFIQRMVEAGAKQYMSCRIKSKYFARPNLKKLIKQYFQYGFWRIRTIQKRKKPARLRQMIPLAFISIWIFLILGSLLYSPFSWFLAAYSLSYILVLLGSIFCSFSTIGIRAFLLPIALISIHFSYGLGSLSGVWTWVVLSGKHVSKSDEYELSR